MKNRFFFAKKDFKIDKFNIQKDEIGILQDYNKNEAIINFVNINSPLSVDMSLIEEFDPVKTGDQFEKKVCNICNRLLPVNNFAKNQNGKGDRTVRRPSCNDCRKIIDGKDLSAKDKKMWNKVKPSFEIWECPICRKRTIPGLTSKVVLDHNHITGKPRAWICDSCNTGLGRFKDDIETIENAIKYLKDKKGQD